MAIRSTLCCAILLLCATVYAQDPGALISTDFSSVVGFLLDDVAPGAFRERIADHYLQAQDAYWKEKALMQTKFTQYKQVFRVFYTDANDNYYTGSLVLPPYSILQVTFDTDAYRTTIDGHDYVARNYSVHGVVVTTVDSVNVSEPLLNDVGGAWTGDWYLPVDPEFVFQRTGYACMDENNFPTATVDSENPWVYYDDSCEAEEPLPPSEINPWLPRCHYTSFPNISCVDALAQYIGSVHVFITWTRLAWSDSLADQWRFGYPTVNTSNMAGYEHNLLDNRVVYKYIEPGSCYLHEVGGCVGGTGWRRLMKFSSSSINTGKQPVIVGIVPGETLDEALSGYKPMFGQIDTEQHLFIWDDCHQHYHFPHYGLFNWGATPGKKVGFCLQDTWRYWNHEFSPIANGFPYCTYQGVSPGWGDDYIAGLDCQWVDITNAPAGYFNLSEQFNHDGILCEGEALFYPNGSRILVDSGYVSPVDGQPALKQACIFNEDWNADNHDWEPVDVPEVGGWITEPCVRMGVSGTLRDCGWTLIEDLLTCTPGKNVTLTLNSNTPSTPLAVRICESSKVLQTTTACEWMEQVASTVLMQATQTLTFKCPGARGSDEPGGLYSVLAGPYLDGDAFSTESITVNPSDSSAKDDKPAIIGGVVGGVGGLLLIALVLYCICVKRGGDGSGSNVKQQSVVPPQQKDAVEMGGAVAPVR